MTRASKAKLAPREGAAWSEAAEQAVLGAAFKDPATAKRVADTLLPSDYFLAKHQAIHEAIVRVQGIGDPVTLVTMAESLSSAGAFDGIGPAYLALLVDETPTAATVGAHIAIVQRHSRTRAIEDAAKRLVDHLGSNGTDPEAHLRDFYELVGEAERGREAEAFEVLPASDFLQGSFQGTARLVPSIGLTECGVGLLSGAGGGGKSVLGLNLALAWVGVPLPIAAALPAARPLRVMMFQAEDAPGIVQERLRMILGSLPVPRGLLLYTRKEPLRFAGPHGKPYEAAFARLQSTLKKHAPVDVAIFDPLVYLHEAEENSSTEMARWLVPLRDTCRAVGTAPFIVHHAGWVPDGEDARSRGTTAIRAWSDLELGLRAQTKNGRTLHRLNLVKSNFAPRWKEPLTLQLNEATLRFEIVDETGVLCAPEELVAWLQDAHNGTWDGKRDGLYVALCQHFECSPRTAREAVKRAKDEGLLIDEGQRKPLRVAGSAQGALL